MKDKNKAKRHFYFTLYGGQIFEMTKWAVFSLLMMLLGLQANGQYLHVDGKRILDENNEEIILRGIGLGGWMLQEGYMLRTGGAQHQIEARIETLIGQEKKEEFYAAWLANHCTKVDIDSMAAWGYNSVRLPMHYKLFTPPIEEEPVAGEITWREEGFQMVDDLLDWLEVNDMYLILDLHAAPGGQGENEDISDYDRTKPSLWESEANQDKMVALWRKLAERYVNEPHIGGYDLLNETNWGFVDHEADKNGCNQSTNVPLWNLQKRATEAIREVDQNHLIIIEGNCWGNNYAGLPTLWDDQLVISYHKYWNPNDQGSIAGMIDMRNNKNVPIWLGETGENSNVWFADAIELFETNSIGWSWWPQKKMGGNNVQEIEITDGYQDILDFWNGNGVQPSEKEAYDALMEIAENLKSENNTFHFDVVDAMIRQPHEKTAIPFKKNKIEPDVSNRIFFTDYDLGTQEVAYKDDDFTNESTSAGGASWNSGGKYRNDGVDIEACSDDVTNGYNVGWTNDGEWLLYTLDVDSTGVYQIDIRYATAGDGVAKILIDGDDMTGEISLNGTGGYQNWSTVSVEDVILNKGSVQLKFLIVQGGCNLNYMSLELKKKVDELSFQAISAITSEKGDEIYLNLNKPIDASTISEQGFTMVIDGTSAVISEVSASEESDKVVLLSLETDILYESEITISYNGDGILSDLQQVLEAFELLNVSNGLPIHFSIPGTIQAENFFQNNGLALEETEDTGGGQNIGYTDVGDYLDYYITLTEASEYYVETRVAGNSNAGLVEFQQLSLNGEVLNSVQVDVPVTGGWQNWQTTDVKSMTLAAGRSILRMKIVRAGININWYRFSKVVLSTEEQIDSSQGMQIYPNPSHNTFFIKWAGSLAGGEIELSIWSLDGQLLYAQRALAEHDLEVNIQKIKSGIYLLKAEGMESSQTQRLVIEK